jgi:hypothetical protein
MQAEGFSFIGWKGGRKAPRRSLIWDMMEFLRNV